MESLMTLPAEAGAQVAHPQLALLDFVRQKKTSVEAELAERQEALAYAKKQKWQTTALARIVRQTQSNVEYYEKVAAALEAGYVVMPPVNCEVFAVRVGDKARLPHDVVTKNPSNWNRPGSHLGIAETDSASLGEGEYVAPEMRFSSSFTEGAAKVVNGDTKVDVYRRDSADDYISAIPFPVIVAKAKLMNAAQQAMALKVFDEIAISPSRGIRRKDPIILGRIHRRTRAPLNFLIAWYVNPEEI